MARRYCGDLTIYVRWVDKDDGYSTFMRSPRGSVSRWSSKKRTFSYQLAVDDPRAYDQVAAWFLQHTLDYHDYAPDFADAVASGLRNGKYQIRRSRNETTAWKPVEVGGLIHYGLFIKPRRRENIYRDTLCTWEGLERVIDTPELHNHDVTCLDCLSRKHLI